MISTTGQMEIMSNNCDETVGDDSDVYLNSNRILRFSPKGLDPEVLLNPFEKQFNLPSVAVEKCDVFCLEIEVVGVVSEDPSKVRDIENDSLERNRIISTVSLSSESE